jgi:hypothetical protein
MRIVTAHDLDVAPAGSHGVFLEDEAITRLIPLSGTVETNLEHNVETKNKPNKLVETILSQNRNTVNPVRSTIHHTRLEGKKYTSSPLE